MKSKKNDNVDVSFVVDSRKVMDSLSTIQTVVESDKIENFKQGSKKAKDNNPVIQVRDERTHIVNGQETNRFAVTMNGDNSAEMSLSFSSHEHTQALEDAHKDGNNAKTIFSSLISEEIRNNAGEFVKTGAIILRDNNNGSINLSLHPEELGNVKITMELSDKIISGKIIVSSEETFNAFKNSMQELKDAFIAGGFENAGFELSWSSGNEHGGDKRNDGNKRAPFYAASLVTVDAGNEDTEQGRWFRSGVGLLA